MTNWAVTTSSIGADVSWLDDKKGGPGEGLYTLYVRAVDPGGNRDVSFSTETNVYQWVYVPPIPWGSVAGGILTGLVMIIGGYFEYRRRRKRATLEKFALRRLKRKFKLRNEGIHPQNSNAEMPTTNLRRPPARERREAEILGHVTSTGDLMPIRHRSYESPGRHQSLRKRHDSRPGSSRSHSNSRRSHSASHRSHSTSHRSRSNSKPEEDSKRKHRRERRRPKEDAADIERRRRRRRDREKNMRKNQRDY